MDRKKPLPQTHKVVTGHRPHMTGGGPHDPTPRRTRTRSDSRRDAINRSLED